MSATQVDFAVFGSSPLAGLVAGLLANQHERRVVTVGPALARYRLPRAIDLSVAPITRPETWSLLSTTVPEASKLIAKIGGRGALRRVDPIFFADDPIGKEALGHFSHMVSAYGVLVEAVPPSKIGAGRKALRIGDALTINRPAFEPAIEAWLTGIGVQRLSETAIAFGEGGSVEIGAGESLVAARHAVLVDDAAILGHLPGWQWPSQMLRRPQATILTASNQHLAGPIMLQLDSGTVLVQHEEGGMAAMGLGTLGAFSIAIAELTAESGQLQQVGQVGFEALASSDGAPLLGAAVPEGVQLLTALGPTGIFLAPVLARWLADEASAEESAWCNARRADRGNKGASVAEFTSGFEERAA